MVLPVNLSTGKKPPSKPLSSISSVARGGGASANHPTTSMYRAQHPDEEVSTSMYRAQHSGENKPSSSIVHAHEKPQAGLGQTMEDDAQRDERRYAYIRKVIKERKRKEQGEGT